jgi:hypothetical protein
LSFTQLLTLFKLKWPLYNIQTKKLNNYKLFQKIYFYDCYILDIYKFTIVIDKYIGSSHPAVSIPTKVSTQNIKHKTDKL